MPSLLVWSEGNGNVIILDAWSKTIIMKIIKLISTLWVFSIPLIFEGYANNCFELHVYEQQSLTLTFSLLLLPLSSSSLLQFYRPICSISFKTTHKHICSTSIQNQRWTSIHKQKFPKFAKKKIRRKACLNPRCQITLTSNSRNWSKKLENKYSRSKV